MTTLEEIETAVANLPAEEFDRFRAWFEALDGERLDAKIARDAASGKLDAAGERSLAAFRAGRTREL